MFSRAINFILKDLTENRSIINKISDLYHLKKTIDSDLRVYKKNPKTLPSSNYNFKIE